MKRTGPEWLKREEKWNGNGKFFLMPRPLPVLHCAVLPPTPINSVAYACDILQVRDTATFQCNVTATFLSTTSLRVKFPSVTFRNRPYIMRIDPSFKVSR